MGICFSSFVRGSFVFWWFCCCCCLGVFVGFCCCCVVVVVVVFWRGGGGVANALTRSPAKRLCNRTQTLTRDGRQEDSPSVLSTVSAMTEGNACRLTSEKEAAKPAWQ